MHASIHIAYDICVSTIIVGKRCLKLLFFQDVSIPNIKLENLKSNKINITNLRGKSFHMKGKNHSISYRILRIIPW